MIFNDTTSTVSFSSDTKHFEKEKSGLKCNTVRMMTQEEYDQFWKFIERHNGGAKIEIRESCKVPVNAFRRWITDITMEPRWGQYEVLISWRDERVDALHGALRKLYDEQNDAPLEKYREDWNEAMKGAEEALCLPRDTGTARRSQEADERHRGATGDHGRDRGEAHRRRRRTDETI